MRIDVALLDPDGHEIYRWVDPDAEVDFDGRFEFHLSFESKTEVTLAESRLMVGAMPIGGPGPMPRVLVHPGQVVALDWRATIK